MDHPCPFCDFEWPVHHRDRLDAHIWFAHLKGDKCFCGWTIAESYSFVQHCREHGGVMEHLYACALAGDFRPLVNVKKESKT